MGMRTKKYLRLTNRNVVLFFIVIFVFFRAVMEINAQDWTIELRKNTNLEYFLGESWPCKNEKEASTQASNDAKQKIFEYIFLEVQSSWEEIYRRKTNRGRVIEESEKINAIDRYSRGGKITGIREEGRQRLPSGDSTWIIQVLLSVNKEALGAAQADIIQEMENLSIYYTGEIERKKYSSPEESLRLYRRIISRLDRDPLQSSLLEYRGDVTVNLYTYLEDKIEELSLIIKEFYFTDARFYSIGTVVGTSFAAPWLIGAFQFTLSPLKYTVIEAGCDFGFLHGYSERNDIDYHSFYPFVHIGSLIPLGDIFFLYVGVGGGYMLASYKTPKEDNFFTVPALDACSGIYIGRRHNYFNLGYALRINPWSDVQTNHKIFAGYSYRF